MYRKSRRTIVLQGKRDRCVAMRAAKERKRLAAGAECEGWKRVGTFLVIVHAGPDGRSVGISARSCGEWYRCGSERAVRGALARMFWRLRGKGQC